MFLDIVSSDKPKDWNDIFKRHPMTDSGSEGLADLVNDDLGYGKFKNKPDRKNTTNERIEDIKEEKKMLEVNLAVDWIKNRILINGVKDDAISNKEDLRRFIRRNIFEFYTRMGRGRPKMRV